MPKSTSFLGSATLATATTALEAAIARVALDSGVYVPCRFIFFPFIIIIIIIIIIIFFFFSFYFV